MVSREKDGKLPDYDAIIANAAETRAAQPPDYAKIIAEDDATLKLMQDKRQTEENAAIAELEGIIRALRAELNEAHRALTRAAQTGDAPKLTLEQLQTDWREFAARLESESFDYRDEEVTRTSDAYQRRSEDYKLHASALTPHIFAYRALLASRSTPAAPAPASTEALIAAGDALRDANEFFFDALERNVLIRNTMADSNPDWMRSMVDFVTKLKHAHEANDAWRAAVAALHPASEETKP